MSSGRRALISRIVRDLSNDPDDLEDDDEYLPDLGETDNDETDMTGDDDDEADGDFMELEDDEDEDESDTAVEGSVRLFTGLLRGDTEVEGG
jgi:hypothetical protein